MDYDKDSAELEHGARIAKSSLQVQESLTRICVENQVVHDILFEQG